MNNKIEISRELAQRWLDDMGAEKYETTPSLKRRREELRALTAAPAVERQGVQVAAMPVERCYDVRAKMIIAFNEAKKNGGDLDDALDAAYKSALRYSPNPLLVEHQDHVAEVEREFENDCGHVHLLQDLPDGTKLYTSPPAPVVVVKSHKEDLAHDVGYRNGVMHGYKLAAEDSDDEYRKCVNLLTSQINNGRRESKSDPVSVMLPGREWGSSYADGWNACLDKVKELNS